MSDLRLNPTTGDLEITPFVGPRVFRRGEGLEALRQRVTIRLRSFQGDWFLDVNYGVPYFQQILGARGAAAIGLATSILRDVVKETPGVQSVDTFDVEFRDRVLRVSFSATTIEGILTDVIDVEI